MSSILDDGQHFWLIGHCYYRILNLYFKTNIICKNKYWHLNIEKPFSHSVSFGSALLSDSCALLTTYACFHASSRVTPCTSQSNAQSLHTDLCNPFTFRLLFSLERRCQRQSFRAYWLLGVSMFSSHLLGLRLVAIAWQRWGWAGLGGVGEDQVVGQGKECHSCAKVWMPWKKGDLEEYILVYWVSHVFNMVKLKSGTFSADLEVQSFP